KEQMSIIFRIKGFNFNLSSSSKNSSDQCSPAAKQEESIDTWNEKNRRNDNVFHPAKFKQTYQSENDFANNHNHKAYNEFSTKPFYLNCYHSYRPLP
ncbi:unnamed protein product, partial [Rotaria sp. Silwood1]